MNLPTSQSLDPVAAGNPVHFNAEVDGLNGLVSVQSVVLAESMNQLGTCSLLVSSGHRPEARELLRKECQLTITRFDQSRSFKGIVRHARVTEANDAFEIALEVVPALFYLSQIVTTRIHQHTRVPECLTSTTAPPRRQLFLPIGS